MKDERQESVTGRTEKRLVKKRKDDERRDQVDGGDVNHNFQSSDEKTDLLPLLVLQRR